MARKPKRLTRSRLRNVTVHYLERYSTTRGHLRRLLVRKVDTSLRHFADDDRDTMIGWVDSLLDQLVQQGLINDRAFASSRMEKLIRRGLSERAIRANLRGKSVPAGLIDELLRERRPDPRVAAARYARKRGLGPFRRADKTGDPTKELARLGRAGFPYSVARDVLELSLEEAEDLVFGAL